MTVLRRVAVAMPLLMAAASTAGSDPPGDVARTDLVRQSIRLAGSYAATRLLQPDGQARGDYDLTAGRWHDYEPAWHTGQLVGGLLGAYDSTGEERFLERALDGARWFVGLRIEEPDRLRGMLRTWHDESNPNITMTTLTDGAAPIFEVARRTGDPRFLPTLRGAGDWMASRLFIPERRLFFDVITPEGLVMGRDAPIDPAIDKDEARYGTEGAYFAHLYRATGDERWLPYFLEPCERMIADQRQGVWPHFRPNDPESGLLHGRFNIWYAEALLEAYELTRDRGFLEGALATARTYATFPDADGSMYYRHALDGRRSLQSPSGSVVAFAGILWLRLAELGYQEFDPLVERAADWLLANQYPGDHPDPNLAGGYFELWTKVREGDFQVFHRDIATAFGLRFLSDYVKSHERRRGEER